MTPTQIRRLRKSLGLTMDAFAAKLGFDGKQRRGTVYRWEAGLRKPSAPVMKLLANLAEAQLK
jgi:DNA-binding transcriptional regulator YiaG